MRDVRAEAVPASPMSIASVVLDASKQVRGEAHVVDPPAPIERVDAMATTEDFLQRRTVLLERANIQILEIGGDRVVSLAMTHRNELQWADPRVDQMCAEP